MDFENTPIKWENKGTEPTDEIKTLGFTAGYKPPAAYHNFLFAQLLDSVSELQRKMSNVDNTKTDKAFTSETVYPIDISKVGSGNNILWIDIPDVTSYDELDGKMIAINTGTYCCQWDTPQTVYINVNGLGPRVLRRPLPCNNADYDTKQYYTDKYVTGEISQSQTLLIAFSGATAALLNPAPPPKATQSFVTETTDNASYVTPKYVGSAITTVLNNKVWSDNISVEWNYQGTGEYGVVIPFNCVTPFRLFIPASGDNPERTIFALDDSAIMVDAASIYLESKNKDVYLRVHEGSAEILIPEDTLPEYIYLNPLDVQIRLGYPVCKLAPADIGNLWKSTSVLSQDAAKISDIIADYGNTRNIPLAEHLIDNDNPHGVTKSQVGLGNVPNVTTNNQTPTFTQASARTNIVSGDTLSIICGKIKKFFADLKDVAFSGSYNDLSDTPTNATTSTAGFMSATDKAKLDGVAAEANKYTLPTASGSVLGGVKLSDSVTSTSGVSGGIAATPYAVKTAYDLAKSKKQTATIVIGTSEAGYTTNDVDYLCDGTNDQTEINNAISALPTTGGKIVLLEGTYNCLGQININKANVVLEGMGKGNTVLNFQSTNYGVYVNKSHCAVKNFTVTRTGEISGESRGITGYDDSDFFTISNVEVSNYLWGVETLATNVFIEKVYAHDNYLGVHTGSTYGIITNCFCIDNSEAGINVEGKYIKIANNYVYAGTGQSSDYTSTQYTLRTRYNAAYNDFSDNYILGKDYTNSAAATNTFNNNRYQ